MTSGTKTLAVRDMDKSLAFYRKLFDQEVALDLGESKTLSCGAVLQLNADKAEGPAALEPQEAELSFETEDMDDFMYLLEANPDVKRLGDPETAANRQRVIRILDPDSHLIEVKEALKRAAYREFGDNKTVQQVAKLLQQPIALIQEWYLDYHNSLYDSIQ